MSISLVSELESVSVSLEESCKFILFNCSIVEEPIDTSAPLGDAKVDDGVELGEGSVDVDWLVVDLGVVVDSKTTSGMTGGRLPEPFLSTKW